MQKILMPALLFMFSFSPAVKTPQTFYFFCVSREIPADARTQAKLNLVYTDIDTFDGEEDDIIPLTRQFAAYVKQGCRPGNEGCTSDLNYYPTLEQAKQRQAAILDRFENTGKYDIRRIDFTFKK